MTTSARISALTSFQPGVTKLTQVRMRSFSLRLLKEATQHYIVSTRKQPASQRTVLELRLTHFHGNTFGLRPLTDTATQPALYGELHGRNARTHPLLSWEVHMHGADPKTAPDVELEHRAGLELAKRVVALHAIDNDAAVGRPA
jgi:hypothetical protein